jgi:hypothetical protein
MSSQQSMWTAKNTFKTFQQTYLSIGSLSPLSPSLLLSGGRMLQDRPSFYPEVSLSYLLTLSFMYLIICILLVSCVP